MIDLPEIVAFERTPRGVDLQLNVVADLCYFQGHFPDCPLLPGVVQISWAIEFARRHFPEIGRFRALTAVKFMRVILPGSVVSLRIEHVLERRELTFAYRHDGRECSSGTVVFDA